MFWLTLAFVLAGYPHGRRTLKPLYRIDNASSNFGYHFLIQCYETIDGPILQTGLLLVTTTTKL